jgi:hypothetical protein
MCATGVVITQQGVCFAEMLNSSQIVGSVAHYADSKARFKSRLLVPAEILPIGLKAYRENQSVLIFLL